MIGADQAGRGCRESCVTAVKRFGIVTAPTRLGGRKQAFVRVGSLAEAFASEAGVVEQHLAKHAWLANPFTSLNTAFMLATGVSRRNARVPLSIS